MDVEKLIEAISAKDVIWDKRHKYHKNRNVLNKSWRTIGDELGVDENTLRRKWKYLRDQFAVEYGKLSHSGKVAAMSNVQWPYFKQLMFLKDTVKPRVSTGNSSKFKMAAPGVDVDPENHVNTDDTQISFNFEQPELLSIAAQDDNHLLFFRSLIPHVRKIPDHQILTFRNQVQKLVDDFAYKSTYETTEATSFAIKSSISPEYSTEYQ